MHVLTSVRLAACCFVFLTSLARAQVVLINFDGIPGMPCACSGAVPPANFLNNYFLPQGVYFNSTGGGVAIGAGSNPVSAPNIAAPTNVGPIWDWSQPTTTCFWFNGAPAVVDSVSTALTNSSSGTTLTAYDVNGAVLGSTTGGASAVLSVSFPGAIRSARLTGGAYAFDDFTFSGLTPLGVGGPMSIPVTANIQPANGGAAFPQTIGTIAVATGAGSSVIGAFTLGPGWSTLDDCYDFQWVNVQIGGTMNCAPFTTSPTLGALPAIDPAPSDGPEPYFYNATQWSSGIVGGFIVRQEQVGSTFMASPTGSPNNPSVIGYETYLVATDVTAGTIPANRFCVLAGFSWSYRSGSNDVSLGAPLAASTTTINAALANGLAPGSPSAPGFLGWLALGSCNLLGCPLLSGVPQSISVALGGTHTLRLNAGVAAANSLYLVVGSTSGTAPGTFVGPVFVPLNTPDFYFTFTLNTPNSPFLPDSAGYLDANGHTLAHLILPPGLPPSLAGITVNHAYGAVTPGGILVSNPTALSLVP